MIYIEHIPSVEIICVITERALLRFHRACYSHFVTFEPQHYISILGSCPWKSPTQHKVLCGPSGFLGPAFSSPSVIITAEVFFLIKMVWVF